MGYWRRVFGGGLNPKWSSEASKSELDAEIEAHLAKPVMCIRILRVGIDGVLEIDPCGAQVALLHRGLRVREGVGMRRQRHNAEAGAYQKPAELSVAHGI